MLAIICGPYADIAKDAKNTSGYYGTYMRVLQ
jgi:hypothetical protein